MNQRHFNIYSASAGSGKTYTLTYNYIKLALSERDNFKSILAVTFTNKATEEMKSRILSTLKALSSGSHSMSLDLCEALRINEEELSNRCAQLVIDILHNYSFFAVSTIDTFFQRVVRSFAKEIGIQTGFRIELDQQQVISEVVDQMVFEMDSDSELTHWLTQFAIYQINEGKSWDTKKEIKRLAQELFKEQLLNQSDIVFQKLEDKTFMQKLLLSVSEHLRGFEGELVSLGQLAKAIMSEHGLAAEDFTQKQRGVGGFVENICLGGVPEKINSYVMAALEEDKWVSPKSDRVTQVQAALDAGLDMAVANIVTYYDQNKVRYNTMLQIVSHLYTYGLLGRISKGISRYREENELLLISDFPVLLNEIISDSDSPYIYEKIGTRFKHYLIDEFQDTSGIQWGNFKPLVRDSLSAGQFNMVVGDIKQSIYRWRGGNWKILLEQLYTDIDSSNINSLTLDTNRRSRKNIVQFNNDFFSESPKLLEQALGDKNIESKDLKLIQAYADVHQHSFDQTESGLVNIEFFDSKEVEDKNEEHLLRLAKFIERLQDHNYALRDIAILVRTNGEGRKLVQYLTDYQANQSNNKYRFDVVSNESFFIKNNGAVHLILQAIQLALDPSDRLLIHQLIFAAELHYQASDVSIDTFIAKLTSNIPQKLTSAIALAIEYFDLYQVENDIAYVSAFQDCIADFLQYNRDSIVEFLVWWGDNDNRSIQVSEDLDAMRLLTIHKSKGLQFKAVLIPWCDWQLDHRAIGGQLIWCDTKEYEPLNEVPLLPIRYKADMAKTYFAEEYWQEKHDAYLDNLNLLYVAMTRAEEVLYSICPYRTANSSIQNAADILYAFAQDRGLLEQDVLSIGDFPEYSSYDHYGVDSLKLRAKKLTGDNLLKFKPGVSILSQNQQYSLEKGEVVHWILSQVKTTPDFGKAITNAVNKYGLTETELQGIKKMLRRLWENEEVADWFSEGWQVRNETSILLEKGRVKRPDRVIHSELETIVIDYKTGQPLSRHHDQVADYMRVLRTMGYESVAGYLIYLSTQKIVEVGA